MARWLGFKIFTPRPSLAEDQNAVSCQQAPAVLAFTPCLRFTQMGEFEVAITGGIWVAAGDAYSATHRDDVVLLNKSRETER